MENLYQVLLLDPDIRPDLVESLAFRGVLNVAVESDRDATGVWRRVVMTRPNGHNVTIAGYGQLTIEMIEE